MISDNL